MKSKYKITDYQSLRDAQAKLKLDVDQDWNRIKDMGLKGFASGFLDDDLIPSIEHMENQDWRLAICQLILDFGYHQLGQWLLQPSSDEKANWKSNIKQVLEVLYQQNRKDLAEMILHYIYTFTHNNTDEKADQLE